VKIHKIHRGLPEVERKERQKSMLLLVTMSNWCLLYSMELHLNDNRVSQSRPSSVSTQY